MKVLHSKYLPGHPRVLPALVWFLFLDHFHAMAWVWWVVGGLVAVSYGAALYRWSEQDEVSLRDLLQ